MDGFTIFDKDYHEIDENGFVVVHTSNAGDVSIKDAPPALPAFFGFKCPRRGTECNYLRIRGGAADDGSRPSWQWNGDRVNPTLVPSINCLSHNPSDPNEEYAGCGWHGFITNGVANPAQ